MPSNTKTMSLKIEEGEGNCEESSSPELLSAREEVTLFLHMAVQYVASMFMSYFPVSLSASYVGRSFGHEYLAALMLALMTASICVDITIVGMATACATLQPQAYAIGNYRKVGIIAIQGYFWCIILLLPINLILCFFMKPIYVNFFYQDEFVSTQAWYWYRVFLVGLPFTVLFKVTWKFLYAQTIVWPVTVVVAICSCLIFPLALHFLSLTYGFVGSAIAKVVMDVCQALMLLMYVCAKRPHTAGTWPGLSACKEAISGKASGEFLWLGIGGILTLNQWLFTEIAGIFVGTLGALPLAIHSIPWTIISLFTRLDHGVGQTLALRVAATLPVSVKRAKQLAFYCQLISAVFFGLLSLSFFFYRHFIYRIFTKEQDVVDGCEQIWWMACLNYFALTIFSVISGTMMGLGLQWVCATVTVFFVWTISLPVLLYLFYWKHGGLYVTWFIFWTQYAVIDVTLITYVLFVNWDRIAATARRDETIESRDEVDHEVLVPADKNQVTIIKTKELK